MVKSSINKCAGFVGEKIKRKYSVVLWSDQHGVAIETAFIKSSMSDIKKRFNNFLDARDPVCIYGISLSHIFKDIICGKIETCNGYEDYSVDAFQVIIRI